MIILGLRCSPSEFSFIVIQGTQKTHSLVASGRIRYPSGYNHCELLRWLYNEVKGLIIKYKIEGIGVKGTQKLWA